MDRIVITADHAEKAICNLCGEEYTSTGRHDSGYCPSCLRKMLFGFYYGGPLDGQPCDPNGAEK